MALKVRNGKKQRADEPNNIQEQEFGNGFPNLEKQEEENFKPLVLKSYDDDHLNSLSNHNIYEVNINDIKEKENNNFIKGNIEKLASSIKEIGLSQPIIIKSIGRDDEFIEQFEVVAGHRRLSAYKYLFDKYGEEYLKIQAYILTKEEESKEKEIYLETNSHSRNITLYEAILNCDLQAIDFANPKFKDKYDKLFYPDNEIPKKEKYDNNSVVKYLETVIKDNFPNLEEAKLDAIRRYYHLIRNSCDLLTQKVLSGEITIKKAMKISKYSKKEQEAVLKELEFGNPIPRIEETSKAETAQKGSFQDLLKVDKRLRALAETNLDNLETDGWTANSKAYLKQIKKVLAEIEKLKTMPKK